MTQKEKPFLYADTHAGAGSYRLTEGYAAINREWEYGLSRLSNFPLNTPSPISVSEYLRFIAEYQQEHSGEYPGSPVLASLSLRAQDRLLFCELHPMDYTELSMRFAKDPRVLIRKEDGFSALKGALPPPFRRGLVFLDPSYEVSSDYDRAVWAIDEALRRFATGTYIIWYPLLERPDAQAFAGRILELSERPRLSLTLRVRRSEPGERGMSGSGMVIINPPWLLEQSLTDTLPYLASALGQDAGSGWSLDMFPKIQKPTTVS